MKSSEAVKNWQGMWRHRRCNEQRQVQDFVRAVPDDQTVPFAQPPADDFIQISIVISGVLINPSVLSGIANVLLTEAGGVIQNENGNALMSNGPFNVVALIPSYTQVETINWTWQSGNVGNHLIIDQPNAASTGILLNGTVVGGQNYTGVLLVTVTSEQGGVGTATGSVSLTA